MSGKILAIRPQPGLDDTLRAGAALGLTLRGAPLFEIRPVGWNAPDPDEFDALLVGSANAFRHGGPQLDLFRDLPVHAVGKTTAAAAEAAGFTVDAIGTGGLQGLLDTRTGPLAYLRLAGRERVVLDPPTGITIAERVVYESVALELDPAMIDGVDLVLIHSAEAARHFRGECERLGIDIAGLRIACLGPRIAQAAGLGWAQVATASQPDDPHLLALARDMCH